jgi:hypothetical protein
MFYKVKFIGYNQLILKYLRVGEIRTGNHNSIH